MNIIQMNEKFLAALELIEKSNKNIRILDKIRKVMQMRHSFNYQKTL